MARTLAESLVEVVFNLLVPEEGLKGGRGRRPRTGSLPGRVGSAVALIVVCVALQGMFLHFANYDCEPKFSTGTGYQFNYGMGCGWLQAYKQVFG